MKKNTLLILEIFLSISSGVFSQDKLKITPFIQQTGMYYSSDYITSDGFGLGAGDICHIEPGLGAACGVAQRNRG